jgi:hypothetical protein
MGYKTLTRSDPAPAISSITGAVDESALRACGSLIIRPPARVTKDHADGGRTLIEHGDHMPK